MKKYVLPFLLLTGFYCNAQTWQWARAGGGVVDSPYLGGPTFESWMEDMTVDRWGNIYIVGTVFDELQFTGTSQSFPYYGAVDAVLAKYDKCGNFQWAVINGSAESDVNLQITTDTSGNIYVAGVYYSDALTPLHIQTSLTTDTIIYDEFGGFILKYDPNGNLLWMNYMQNIWYPQAQLLKQFSNGNLVTVLQANPGTWENFTVPANYPYSEVMVTINSTTGNVISGVIMDSLPLGNLSNGILLSPYVMDENDNIYFPVNLYNLTSSGQSIQATFFGQQITVPGYAAMLFKIDKNLNLVKYAYDDNSDAILSVSYSEGALYSAGGEYSNSNYLGDSIDNLTSITAGGTLDVYRVYKLDTGTLAPVWESSPQYENSAIFEALVTTTSKHVWMSASNLGKTVWDGDTIYLRGAGIQQYLFKFDKATGYCDTIYVDSGETSSVNSTTMTATDAQENLFIGGQFGAQFSCAGDTLIPWGGTNSPVFFVEKFGVVCTDSPNTADNPYPPANLITNTGGMHSINLQWNDNSPYRISFHIYRSPNGVSNWQMVDTVLGNLTATIDTGLSPNTWYWYKVAAWNMAGESDYTNIDSAKTGTSGIETISTNDWNLYPNPSSSQLTLQANSTTPQDITVEINDITGKNVMSRQYTLMEGANTSILDISVLSAGYYELNIISDGSRSAKPFIKF